MTTITSGDWMGHLGTWPGFARIVLRRHKKAGLDNRLKCLILLRNKWSGRSDSNTRPLAPHASALPGCATPRLGLKHVLDVAKNDEECTASF